MTGTATTPSAPEASQAVIASAVRQALQHIADRKRPAGPPDGTERLILLRAAPHWRGDPAIMVDSPHGAVTAQVRGCPTVLAVLDALCEPREPQAYLVVLTPCEDRDLGDSVLAQAISHEVRPIDRWDLVLEAFGAHRLDPRLFGKQYRWLAEALLDAQPGGGWRRAPGPVLPADTVLARLAALRLGRANGDDRLDAAALLDWSRDETRVARFCSLRQEEQDGLADWLEASAGPVARVVFRLLREGQIADAIPFGQVVAELYGPGASRREKVVMARGRAEQRFLGGNATDTAGLRAFGEAAESLILRWNDNGHPADAQAMCDRAEQILAQLGAGDLAASSSILAAGLDARLSALADAITAVLPDPRPGDLPAVEAALSGLQEHRRSGGDAAEAQAESAVRLVRWLAAGDQPPATVAAGVAGQVRSWAWADRALAVIASPDTARTPRVQAAYAALHAAVRECRSTLDEAFAGRLAAWGPAAGPTEDLLLMENVLERIARPVASLAAPLVIVVDGMSAAVACALADDVAAMRTWDEAGRQEDGREGALAVLPSATTFSRTSLLCGKLRAGAQAEERSGFAAFWHGRTAALFHKADLPAGPGARLSASVLAALGEPSTVVGVVLNTVDDALRDGKEGSAPAWRLGDVTYLPELLAAAAAAGRPVVLTADHGHVLDRGEGIHPAASESARYRAGTPGEGEVLISGPRVLSSGGTAVLPWDERIRYAPRRAGYHGGASLAEVVVPVLVFVPSGASIPPGWTRYRTPSLHEPSWWNPTVPAGQPATADLTAGTRPAAPARSRRHASRPTAGTDTLFTAEDIPVAASLGAQVVASPRYEAQRAFVRKAPDDAEVAAIIDAVAGAGGKLPVTSVATIAGQPPFRMAGYFTQLGRLLNVDGYPVIAVTDEGRTAGLNTALLREQFLGGGG
ncbi:MAG TPA: BREX-2 system phosphatase PglZ [Streptosporangiaceae bacterium]|nr:BREX-2 system phosphatase PglZ [Streptosporangiaceae bacterium]